jgi:hypothetical protein
MDASTSTDLQQDMNAVADMAVKIPIDFICPITLQIMASPVMTRAGTNFERTAILSWLKKGSGVCPMTRNPLSPSGIVPNKALEHRIKIWCEVNGFDLKACTASEARKKDHSVCFVPLDNVDSRDKLLKRHERKCRELVRDSRKTRSGHRSHGQPESTSSERSDSPSSIAASPELTPPPPVHLKTKRSIMAVVRRAIAA